MEKGKAKAAEPLPETGRSWIYDLKIRIHGPAPDHAFMQHLTALVQEINRCGRKQEMHDAVLYLLAVVHTAEADGVVNRGVVTLEIPDAMYAPQTRPAHHTKQHRLPKRA